jgi:hypothetical protein
MAKAATAFRKLTGLSVMAGLPLGAAFSSRLQELTADVVEAF